MTLQQRILKTIACGLTLVGLSGIPQKAYSSSLDLTRLDNANVAIGDVNGDGLKDIVMGTPFRIMYFENMRNRTFMLRQVFSIPYSCDKSGNFTCLPKLISDKVDVALLDVDGDGDLDLVFCDSYLCRLYRNVNGKFVEPGK